MNNEKNELQTKFEKLYKGCTLHAIHLNGFSHTVFYKDENGEKHVEGVSVYAPEQYTRSSKHEDNVWRAFNEDKTKVLFLGFPHYAYQNNAKELVYKDKKEW